MTKSNNGMFLCCGNCMYFERPDSVACRDCCRGSQFLPARSTSIKYDRYSSPSMRSDRQHVVFMTLDRLIEKVIFNPPATIVLWSDGFPKTVVKCQPGDVYDREKGLAMCIAKRCTNNTGSYCDVFKKWCGDDFATGFGKELKNDLIVTAATRGAYMHAKGEIDIPSGLEGEMIYANWVKTIVDHYMANHEHYSNCNVSYDEYVERRMEQEFGVDRSTWPKENPHIDTKAVIHASRKELRDEFLVRAAGEMQFLTNKGLVVPPIDADRTRKYVIEVVDRYINNPDTYKGDFLQYIDITFKEDFGKKYNYSKEEIPSAVVKGEN